MILTTASKAADYIGTTCFSEVVQPFRPWVWETAIGTEGDIAEKAETTSVQNSIAAIALIGRSSCIEASEHVDACLGFACFWCTDVCLQMMLCNEVDMLGLPISSLVICESDDPVVACRIHH